MSPQRPQSTRPNHRNSGYSLVEIAVVGAIVGLLAAIAVPAYVRSKDNAKVTAFVNDLRIYEQDFDTFALENRFYPPSQPIAGQFPVGMEELLPDTWKLKSPIGGTYRWVYTTEENPEERSAYIEVVNTAQNPITLTIGRLSKLDERLDDGDDENGIFRKEGLNLRFYVKL